VVTFARLVRRESNLFLSDAADAAVGTRIEFPGDGARAIGRGRTLLEAIGCEEVRAERGLTRTPLTPYVRNSFGAMNGGVVAALVEAAAVALTDGGEVHDLAIHYLAQGRTGPIETRGRLLRSDPTRRTARVEVVDLGEEERTMAVAHVGVSVVTAPAFPPAE
jgi:acyl-coenzyme A thioesterase PaaI-like protein